MRTIINLFLTLLFVGAAAPIVIPFTIGGCVSLSNEGHSTLAAILPLIVIVISIILIKLLYKGIDRLIRTFIG